MKKNLNDLLFQQVSPRNPLTPQNENRPQKSLKIELNEDRKRIPASISIFTPHNLTERNCNTPKDSLNYKVERLMVDNNKLVDQNTLLVKQLKETKIRYEQKLIISLNDQEQNKRLLQASIIEKDQIQLRQQYAQEKLSIILQENENLSKMIKEAKPQNKQQSTQTTTIESKHQSQSLQYDQLSWSLQKAKDKILNLEDSNHKLNKLLEERRQQMDNMNKIITDQQSHYQCKYEQKSEQNQDEQDNNNFQQNLIIQRISEQNKKYKAEISVLTQENHVLTAEVTLTLCKERAQIQQAIKLQDQNTQLNYDIKVYSEELQRLVSGTNQLIKNKTQQQQLNYDTQNLQQQLVDGQIQLSLAQYEIGNMKSQGKEDSLSFLTISQMEREWYSREQQLVQQNQELIYQLDYATNQKSPRYQSSWTDSSPFKTQLQNLYQSDPGKKLQTHVSINK